MSSRFIFVRKADELADGWMASWALDLDGVGEYFSVAS